MTMVLQPAAFKSTKVSVADGHIGRAFRRDLVPTEFIESRQEIRVLIEIAPGGFARPVC